MLKTFLIGIVLGIAAAAGALFALPVVDQHRPASIVSVATNGGTLESFRINIPMDRIMVGAAARSRPLPEGLEWPVDAATAGVRTELFKLRNARDVVVGVAARNAAQDDADGTIDWVLHIPARGSSFFTMQAEPLEGGYRAGVMRAGSREFSTFSGGLTERWVADAESDATGPAGRLELEARFVGLAPEEPDE